MRAEDVEICVGNLARTGGEAAAAYIKRYAHICELVRVTLPSDETLSVAAASSYFEQISEALADSYSLTPDKPGFLIKSLQSYDLPCAAERLRALSGAGGAISDYVERGGKEPERPGRISYFKSAAADQAFDIFASRIKDPSLSYGRDFSSVCEDVYYGRSEFCILPASNSADGKLPVFYSLAEKYELTGVDECSVTYRDTETRFVLFSASLPKFGGGDNVKLELRMPHGAQTQSVFFAAGYYGLSCDGPDSMPTEFGTSDMLTFSGAVPSVCNLLFFIQCMQIKYDITGCYAATA